MVGRTHGQHAIPITLGLKFAVYIDEFLRHLERIREAKKRVVAAKVMGAVGTGAGFGDLALEINKRVLKHLSLNDATPTTQVVARDRYAELVFILANLATTIERLSIEIRNLQRTEINELREGFDVARQVGSSTMPHKQNPVKSESVSGICRYLRSFVSPSLENNLLWHERDLSNSSVERFIIPHAFILTHHVLVTMTEIIRGITVNKDAISKNLHMTRGRILAERIMLALVNKGVGRNTAHELVRNVAMKSITEDTDFFESVKNDTRIMSHLSPEELEALSRVEDYIGMAVALTERVLERSKLIYSDKPQTGQGL